MAGNHAISFIAAAPAAADVNISQVYGGGGNAGATYKNDFIELYNPGAAAVSLTGWSVQYASAAGTTWQVTDADRLDPRPQPLPRPGGGRHRRR